MSNKPVPPRPAPRLYLATPVVDDPSQFANQLPELLAAVDVAAVLLRLKQTDQRTMIARVKALAPAIQNGHTGARRRGGGTPASLEGLRRRRSGSWAGLIKRGG